MTVSEAKQVYKDNFGYISGTGGLGTYDSILYLYLSLKKELVNGLNANTNRVIQNKMFTIEFEHEFVDLSEKAGKAVKVSTLIFNEEGIDIKVTYGDDKDAPQIMTIPMDRENYKINDSLISILQEHFKDFIEIDVHNTIYEYLFNTKVK